MIFIVIVLSIIKAVPIVDTWFRQLVAAYVQEQTAQTLSAIADACALTQKATDDESRYAAAEAWKNALSRPRFGA